MLLRRNAIVPFRFGVDDHFAKEYGNNRVGARFTGDILEVRLSGAAYTDLCREEFLAERYTLQEGSSITISEGIHPRYSLSYRLLQEEIALLEGFDDTNG